MIFSKFLYLIVINTSHVYGRYIICTEDMFVLAYVALLVALLVMGIIERYQLRYLLDWCENIK